MSYKRVIPRDLFNEASLLKCIGKLWLLTEGDENVEFTHLMEDEGFQVVQDESDGSIYLNNVTIRVRGVMYHLYRSLNSRQDWPLWLRDFKGNAFEDFEVFDPDMGMLSTEMRQLIDGPDEEEA